MKRERLKLRDGDQTKFETAVAVAVSILSDDSLKQLSIPDFAHIASDGEWKKFAWITHALAIVEEKIRAGGARIIINAPPGGGKSEAISKWLPIWYLHNNPSDLCILVSYEATFAAKWGRAVRNEIKTNPMLSAKMALATSATYDWELETGGGMVTAGVGGPITGRRGNLQIIDDPIKNFQEAHSPVYQQALIDWFNSTFYIRAEPSASIIIIMTRWTDKDITAYLEKEHAETWTILNYPALSEGEGDLLGRPEGEALCPERYDREALEITKKAVGSYLWSGMHQGRPGPIEGGIFKRSDWQFYFELPEEFDLLVASWDMTFKNSPTGSKVAGHVWGFKGPRKYLVDRISDRMSFSDTRIAVKSLHARYPNVAATLVENAANGPAIIDDLKKEIPGLIAINVKGGKKERAMQTLSAQPLVEAGNVYLPDLSIAPWVGEFIEQFANFKGSAAEMNDDVDTMTQAMIWYRDKSAVIISGVITSSTERNKKWGSGTSSDERKRLLAAMRQ
jgi:predicted phage terminase large subunit-like protein